MKTFWYALAFCAVGGLPCLAQDGSNSNKGSGSSSAAASSSGSTADASPSSDRSDRPDRSGKANKNKQPGSQAEDRQASDSKSKASGDKNTSSNEKAKGNAKAEKSKNRLPVSQVSLDQGRTIGLPAGASVLDLTVAVPERIISGQRYQYRVRLENTSDAVTLTDLTLVQIEGQGVEIEKASMEPSRAKSSGEAKPDGKTSAEGQKTSKPSDGAKSAKDKSDAGQSSQAGKSSGSKGRAGDLTWELGRLAPGDSRELTVVAVAGQTGQANHCFGVDYRETVCTAVEVVKPTVEIVKSGPDTVGVCEEFEYLYRLTNTGTGVARDFVIRDELPEGVVTADGDHTIAFGVESLDEGASQTYRATLHATKAQTIASRAVVEQRGGATHESKTVQTKVLPTKLDVAISGPRAIKAGEGGSYQVTVENVGKTIARDTVLTLSPNGKVEFVRTDGGDARGESYRYALGDLEPGATKEVSVYVDSSDPSGQITMDAKAVARCSLDRDMVVATAQASMDTRILRITSLLLSIVDTSDVIPTGEEITYRLRVNNQGSLPDRKVDTQVHLPEGLTLVGVDGPSQPQGKGSNVQLAPVATIAPGQTLEWLITAKAETSGEKIVRAELDSEGQKSTIQAEEISTIFDAGRQTTGSDGSKASDGSGQGNAKSKSKN